MKNKQNNKESLSEVDRLDYYLYTKEIDRNYDMKEYDNEIAWYDVNDRVIAKMTIDKETKESRFFVDKKTLKIKPYKWKE